MQTLTYVNSLDAKFLCLTSQTTFHHSFIMNDIIYLSILLTASPNKLSSMEAVPLHI